MKWVVVLMVAALCWVGCEKDICNPRGPAYHYTRGGTAVETASGRILFGTMAAHSYRSVEEGTLDCSPIPESYMQEILHLDVSGNRVSTTAIGQTALVNEFSRDAASVNTTIGIQPTHGSAFRVGGILRDFEVDSNPNQYAQAEYLADSLLSVAYLAPYEGSDAKLEAILPRAEGGFIFITYLPFGFLQLLVSNAFGEIIGSAVITDYPYMDAVELANGRIALLAFVNNGQALWVFESSGEEVFSTYLEGDTTEPRVFYSAIADADSGIVCAGVAGDYFVFDYFDDTGEFAQRNIIAGEFAYNIRYFHDLVPVAGGWAFVWRRTANAADGELKVTFSDGIEQSGTVHIEADFGERFVFEALTPARDGGCFLSYTYYFSGLESSAAHLVKIGPDGSIQWSRSYR